MGQNCNILRLSSNRSPYICMLVQKLKRACKNYAFINKPRLCRLCKLFHLKINCTSFTHEV